MQLDGPKRAHRTWSVSEPTLRRIGAIRAGWTSPKPRTTPACRDRCHTRRMDPSNLERLRTLRSLVDGTAEPGGATSWNPFRPPAGSDPGKARKPSRKDGRRQVPGKSVMGRTRKARSREAGSRTRARHSSSTHEVPETPLARWITTLIAVFQGARPQDRKGAFPSPPENRIDLPGLRTSRWRRWPEPCPESHRAPFPLRIGLLAHKEPDF